MDKDAAGEAGGGGGTVESSRPGQPAAADSGGDGALQPGQAHPELGKEIPLTLVRVTKIRRWQEVVNEFTDETELCEERQEYIPTEEG
jgi:hypothetical protein